MTAETVRYRYRVDATDVIVWVNELWLAFARENGAAGLTEDAVLGRSLWDFVSGDEICRLYLEIHARVRLTGTAVILPFRCDSPTLQRHMRLSVTREDAGQLVYECLVVRTVPQCYLGVLDSEPPRSNAFLTMCSCCKRALLEPLGWLALEDVSVRLRLFEAQKVPSLRHAVCPECATMARNATNDGSAA
jgi:hypothetical protein